MPLAIVQYRFDALLSVTLEVAVEDTSQRPNVGTSRNLFQRLRRHAPGIQHPDELLYLSFSFDLEMIRRYLSALRISNWKADAKFQPLTDIQIQTLLQ